MAGFVRWTEGGSSGRRQNLEFESYGDFVFGKDDSDNEFFMAESSFDFMNTRFGLGEVLDKTAIPYIQNRTEMRFRNEGDRTVGKWAPLKPFTQKMRKEGGHSPKHPINRRTDELYDWATQGQLARTVATSDATAILMYPSKSPTGDLLKKVKTAQQGQARPLTPARPILLMDERDRRLIIEKFTAGWKMVVKKVG